MRSPAPRRKFASPIALVCAAVLVLASCHGSSKSGSATTGVPATNAKGAPNVSLALSLGARETLPAGLPLRPFDTATASAIRNLVNKYIATGIARPLLTGNPSTGLVRFFTPSLANRVGIRGRDRAALSDENTPKLLTVTRTVKQPLNLVALEDHGKLVMIAAQFSLSVAGTTDQGPLTVSRIGNLVFEPNNRKIWYISGYSLIVRRDNGGTTTTTKATTTTAAP